MYAQKDSPGLTRAGYWPASQVTSHEPDTLAAVTDAGSKSAEVQAHAPPIVVVASGPEKDLLLMCFSQDDWKNV